MGQPVKDRRREPRYVGSPDDITRATLRPGRIVQVVDLSASGALVQADRPLRPGARLHFHFVIGRREFRLTARVLRCAVWMLDSLEGITYRGALQFDERCEWWEAGTQDGSDVPPLRNRIAGRRELTIRIAMPLISRLAQDCLFCSTTVRHGPWFRLPVANLKDPV